MKAKFVFESLQESSTVLDQLISDNTKTKNTRAKLLDYLNKALSFTEENQTIEKKELTKIVNDFGSLVASIFSSGYHDPKHEEYREELDKIAQNYGYRDTYDATSGNKTNEEDKRLFQEFNFLSVYGLSDLVRKQKFIDSHDLNKDFQNLVSKYYPNIKDWCELGEKIEEIRKILNPTAEERKKKELQAIKGKVNPEIKSAIDEIAEDFRKIIEKNEYEWYMRKVNSFKEKFPNGVDDSVRRERSFSYNDISFLFKKENSYSTKTNLKSDIEEVVKKIAYDKSVEVIQSWQGKMYDKLGGFISEIGKKFKTQVRGSGPRQNDIIFNFEDGSKFTITNQIVSKISNLGNYFYTYPTTFHDAFLPDGSRIFSPNEFTVKKAFNEFK
jgi:hypothetical protein